MNYEYNVSLEATYNRGWQTASVYFYSSEHHSIYRIVFDDDSDYDASSFNLAHNHLVKMGYVMVE